MVWRRVTSGYKLLRVDPPVVVTLAARPHVTGGDSQRVNELFSMRKVGPLV
jgi:hypothetical protein